MGFLMLTYPLSSPGWSKKLERFFLLEVISLRSLEVHLSSLFLKMNTTDIGLSDAIAAPNAYSEGMARTSLGWVP